MSIDRVNCYVVSCDTCGIAYNQTGGDGYIVHFDGPDDAIAAISDCGWTLTENGDPRCLSCTADIRCARNGHDYGPWYPCHCNGCIPDHARFGCGLIRFCEEDGCGHSERTTVAQLPTTTEPATPGC